MSDQETTENLGNPYMEFFKQYKSEITVTGLTILAVKHRAFRRDFRVLADTVSHLTKGLEALVEHGEHVANNIEELYARTDELANDHNHIFKTLDDNEVHLYAIDRWQETAQEKIEGLEKTKQDLFAQFFGERKK